MQAPTVNELISHAVVKQTLQDAWIDSEPNQAQQRHEEGGWIYCDGIIGELSIRRAQPGSRAAIDLRFPPVVAGTFVVGRFHTHPNPSSEGWYTGPSVADTDSAWHFGIPCIILADDGIHTTGPDMRVGGLTGDPGFPLS